NVTSPITITNRLKDTNPVCLFIMCLQLPDCIHWSASEVGANTLAAVRRPNSSVPYSYLRGYEVPPTARSAATGDLSRRTSATVQEIRRQTQQFPAFSSRMHGQPESWRSETLRPNIPLQAQRRGQRGPQILGAKGDEWRQHRNSGQCASANRINS